MKLCFKLFIGVFFVLTLTGCIGENYDFTPPKVSIMNTYDISDEEELGAANINWDTDNQEIDLPNTITLEVDDDCQLDSQGADILSDKIGFLVNSFNFE